MSKEKLKEATVALNTTGEIKDIASLVDYFNSNGFNNKSMIAVSGCVKDLCKELDPRFVTTGDCLELYVKIDLERVELVDDLTSNAWTLTSDLTAKRLAELIVSCRTSEKCTDCENCKNCSICYKSINLNRCESCYHCKDCNSCDHCTNCEDISGASYCEDVTGNR